MTRKLKGLIKDVLITLGFCAAFASMVLRVFLFGYPGQAEAAIIVACSAVLVALMICLGGRNNA